jgi:hypothetical protein
MLYDLSLSATRSGVLLLCCEVVRSVGVQKGADMDRG